MTRTRRLLVSALTLAAGTGLTPALRAQAADGAAAGQPGARPAPIVTDPALRPTDVLLAAPAADTAGGPAGDTFWTRPTVTGDWGGLRPRLEDRGIKFGGNVTQFGFGIGGGIDGQRLPRLLSGAGYGAGDKFSYSGRGEYEATFDLEKFGGLPKGTLLVRAQNWWGQYGNVSLNTGAFPPAVFPAAIPPVTSNPGQPYVTDFVVTQPLSQKLVVFMGKKNVLGAADQDDFAGGNGVSQFLNQALVANPAFLLALPYTSFTAGAVLPREWGAVSAFVYDPQDRTKDFFRLDDLFSQGIIVGTEVKVKTNTFNRPGEVHVGGLWKHLQMTDLRFGEPPPGVYPETPVPGFPTLGDSYTIYTGFDQYLQTYAADTKRGWGLFGRASISDGNPTPIRYFLSLGVGGYSPLAYGRGDTFGVGWYYTGMSSEFGALPRALLGPRDGWGVEMFYNVQVTPWLNLTPDFQVIRPEISTVANTAYVGGLRMSFRF